jgi:hypothetical protein
MTTSHVRGTETDLGTVKERFGGIDTPAALGGLFALLGTLAFLGCPDRSRSRGTELSAERDRCRRQPAGDRGVRPRHRRARRSRRQLRRRVGRGADGTLRRRHERRWGRHLAAALVAVFAALGAFVGAEYNAFQRVGLPDWFSQFSADDVTAGVIVAWRRRHRRAVHRRGPGRPRRRRLQPSCRCCDRRPRRPSFGDL